MWAPIAFIDSLCALQDGDIWNCRLDGEVLLEGVPSLSQLVFDTGAEVRSQRLDQVRDVYVENSKNVKWIGLGIGVLIDGLLLYLAGPPGPSFH